MTGVIWKFESSRLANRPTPPASPEPNKKTI